MKKSIEFLIIISSVNVIFMSEFFPVEDSEEKRVNIEFVFPDQLPRLIKLLPETAVGHFYSPYTPQGCLEGENDEDFCEFTSDYPDTQEIRNEIRKNLSKNDKNLLFSRLNSKERFQIQSKFSKEKVFMQDDDRSTQNLFNDNFGFIEESPVCDSQESYIYPRTARNKDKEWKFVVNVISDGAEEQEDYVQAVKIEKCLRPGEECSVTNTGYQQTVCRQKYSYTKLIAINNDGSHYIDSFRFPSCCLCYQKKVFNDIPFQLLTESNQTIIEASTETIDGTRKIGSERRNLKKPQLRYTHSKYYRWRQL